MIKQIVLLLCLAIQAWTTPAQVIVIRHGEKPNNDDAPGLSTKGLERSGALAFFFQNESLVLDFGTPAAIYAFKEGKHSNRGVLTVAPTAQALNLQVAAPYAADDVHDIANLVLTDPSLEGHSVLICWAHDQIPDLVKALGGPKTPSYPGDRFDLVYMLTYKSKGPDLDIGLQKLMFDDSDKLPSGFNSHF